MPVLIMLPVLLAIGRMEEYIAALASIALHEASHIAAARLCGVKTGGLRMTPGGFSVSVQHGDSRGFAMIMVYLAGPAANLAAFGTASAAKSLFPGNGEFFKMVAATNLYIGLFNLFPSYPLDGGRILLALLSGRLGLTAAGRLARRTAWCFSLALLLTGAYQLVSFRNTSLLAAGICIMHAVNNGRMESAFMNVRQIIYRRSKLNRKGFYASRGLVAIKSSKLCESFKYMDYDRFHIIYVLDENMKIIGFFTENEIMDALLAGNEGMTFEQLVEMVQKP